MRHWSETLSLRIRFWAVCAAAFPALVFVLLVNGPALRLAAHRRDRLEELSALRENVYRQGWLDSADAALRGEVATLRAFGQRVRRALSSEQQAAAIVDPLRQEAQALGCEVLRMAPAEESSGGLRRLRLRWESRGDFSAVLRLFRSLRTKHPEVYVEEALIRRSASSGSKLDLNLTVIVHRAVSGSER